MKKYIYIIIALLGIVSCNSEKDSVLADCNPIPLRGIRADIDNGSSTRAVAPLVDSIGKYSFLNTDEIIFTKIQRTKRPIPGFSYAGVQYSCTVEGTGDKQNVSWKRNNPQADIFWSDGSEPHTFIGYILPHEDDKTATASGYDWNHIDNQEVYYGSIGDPTNANEVIEYTATPATGAGESKPYDLEKLRKEDLLLTYDTNMQNEDAMAQVHFHHGLASIRVVVTITGFSSTGMDPDAQTLVTNMQVHQLPTMYKWDGNSYKTDPLTSEDQSALDEFWGADAVKYDQTKDMNLWQSREWRGSGASRTFTFYGIVAPSEQDKVEMTFTVTYPDPLNPSSTLTKPYTATLELPNSKKVEFRPGFCTNININLNHKDEKMTVGAEYLSWQNEPAPNEGTLRKKSTFLDTTERTSVTIATDPTATIDDATWLYVAGKDAQNNDIIKDIYGNDGSAAHPYLIKTADELLSFAYEVKNGRDFVHQYIKLDADITMQPTKEKKTDISWIGIGEGTNVFNGFFLGSSRYINNLYGKPFFNTVGDNAVIDKLNFANVTEVQGCGVVAEKNEGLICGCYIDGDVKEGSASELYTGSIVGTNNSFIIACAHVGNVSGYNTVGGLVGFNNGTVMACYNAGEVSGQGSNPGVHATVGKRGDGNNSTNNSIMFSCYFDESLITHTPTLSPSKSGYPLSTSFMQMNAFVNGDKEFQFDSYTGAYTGQSQTLQEVLLYLNYGDQDKDSHSSEKAADLMKALVEKGLTGRVNDVFGYHFSLNKALEAFRLWLNAIAELGQDNVQTNCHEFTKLQIEFLKLHYTAEHKFVYTPATYPKVQ